MKIAVFVEKNPVSGELNNVSLELTNKACSLVDSMEGEGEVTGIFAGDELPSDTKKLFAYGMDRLRVFKNENMKQLQSRAVKNVLVPMLEDECPDIVLFGATHIGRDIAPLVASALKTGLTADCTQLYIDDYKGIPRVLHQVRPAFGGNILATIVTPEHRPMMATVRPGVMPLPEECSEKSENSIEPFNMDFDEDWIRNEFLSIIPIEKHVNFDTADIIVSGGAGVGSAENFKLLHQLAAAMNAEVGASRAAVDFGFAEKERQVGQTGSVVRPKLYIACGISGAVQHRAGMEESQKIIAINKDRNAPIFDIAHMGIVGDIKDVIPMMIRYLKEE